MPEYFFFRKPRLSRGFSYPLKRSVFDAFLDRRGLELVSGFSYYGPCASRVLSAAYYGPTRPAFSHTLNIAVHAVPSKVRKQISEQLEAEYLDKLGDWIVRFSDPTLLRNQLDHQLRIYHETPDDGRGCRLLMRIREP